ncbi:facilitated trehalose transporter Tret1-like [Belonocnema kinseyi]|uniref:facilitated trehalose transporter Tret1-like n=1 Tax=Belonocnema kinseyi TaxID=2817044 RepID=UPI00143D3E83|nr:facilitated trehalose transporter Tret1-like [Belonocnema kinseyi]
MSLGHGASEIWTSPALPYLKSNESEIIVSAGQGPWITSLHNVGGVIGHLLYPLLVDRIGRKYTLLTFLIPQITTWFLIYFANNVQTLYVARTLGGIGYSTAFVIQGIYLGEIAEKKVRGTMVLIAKIFYSIGTLTVVTAGAFASYDTLNLILLLTSLLSFTIVFIPESPYYYLKKNRDQDAMKSLSKLRGTNDVEEIRQEMYRIKENIIEGQIHEQWSLRKLFQTKRNRKAFLIVFIANVTLPFSGLYAIASYSQEIFTHSGILLDPKYAVVVLSTVTFIFIIITTPFADYFGRRILSLYSGIISGSSLAVIGLFFFFKHHPEIADLSSVSWMVLVAMIIFEVAFATGLISTAVILASELFPLEVKSSALALLHLILDLLFFLVKLGFEWSVKTMGIYNLFWTYATCCFILPFLNFYIMPETKGKTLEEIQKLLD